jgi:hypothetical protein
LSLLIPVFEGERVLPKLFDEAVAADDHPSVGHFVGV